MSLSIPTPEEATQTHKKVGFFEANAKWVLLSPLILFVVVLVIFPTLYAYWVSFHTTQMGQISMPWSGLTNYIDLFKTPDYLQSIWYSVRYAIITTIVEVVIGLAIALLLDRPLKGKGAGITLLLVPLMIAPALLALMFQLMFNDFIGVLPYYLRQIGLQISLMDPSMVNGLLIFLDALEWIPFVVLILYSGLQTIPEELYEAARVDGASRWRVVWNITIPIMMPLLVLATFIRAIDSFKVFDMIYVLTNGGPGNLTTSASIFIYKTAFSNGNFGEATAGSLLLMILLTPVMMVAMKRIVKEGRS